MALPGPHLRPRDHPPLSPGWVGPPIKRDCRPDGARRGPRFCLADHNVTVVARCPGAMSRAPLLQSIGVVVLAENTYVQPDPFFKGLAGSGPPSATRACTSLAECDGLPRADILACGGATTGSDTAGVAAYIKTAARGGGVVIIATRDVGLARYVAMAMHAVYLDHDKRCSGGIWAVCPSTMYGLALALCRTRSIRTRFAAVALGPSARRKLRYTRAASWGSAIRS